MLKKKKDNSHKAMDSFRVWVSERAWLYGASRNYVTRNIQAPCSQGSVPLAGALSYNFHTVRVTRANCLEPVCVLPTACSWLLYIIITMLVGVLIIEFQSPWLERARKVCSIAPSGKKKKRYISLKRNRTPNSLQFNMQPSLWERKKNCF